MSSSINLLNYDRKSLAHWLDSLGESPQRARDLIQSIHQRRILNYDQIPGISVRLRHQLIEKTSLELPSLISEQRSKDGTYKWLLKLADNNAIETVYIPDFGGNKGRGTLCISSQVGCSLNCRFCATARAGFNRHLTTAEIIGQLWWALSRVPKITNVVMMGMGEPLLNYEAVLPALNLMMDDCAYGLSKYKVTISTAGLVPIMKRLREESAVSLAVSLHAPNNALRSHLVPLNKKYPLEALMPVCRDYFPANSKQTILFEYVLLANTNDQPEHSQELINLLRGIPCKVNLIPFNPFPGTIFECSESSVIEKFQRTLIQAGIPAWVRRTRGNDIEGACGQLAGKFTDRTGRKIRPVLK